MTPLRDLLSNWGLSPARRRGGRAIPGSPERCLFRHVLEESTGALWLLEQLAPAQTLRREAIGGLLHSLAGRGLMGLAPYRPTSRGAFVCRDWGHAWQLSPFLDGHAPVQPDYLASAAMGGALGSWLADLRRSSRELALPPGLFALDLPAYAVDLLRRLERARCGEKGTARGVPRHAAPESPGLSRALLGQAHVRLERFLPRLEPLFTVWSALPHALCHGDLHPVNVLWGNDSLTGVIDWEFSGLRPALYDLANCLGCLAIEGGTLDTPFARAFLERVRQEGVLSDAEIPWLPLMIRASRLGWLSEWLRQNDSGMLLLELDFLENASFF